MQPVKVLGIGSPFGDDRLGWVVVEHLFEHPEIKDRPVEIKALDRPGMRLLEEFHPTQTILLIDAIQSGKSTGSLHCIKKEALFTLSSPSSSHSLGVAEALNMAEAMGTMPEQIMLFALEIEPGLNMGTELSDPIKNQIPKLIDEVVDQIVKVCSGV